MEPNNPIVNTPPQSPAPTPVMQTNMPQNKSSIGSIVGTIIIIALIILGGLYFWGKRIENSKSTEELTTETETLVASNPEVEAIHMTSSSDDVGSLEADLSDTNLDNLSAEIEAQ